MMIGMVEIVTMMAVVIRLAIMMIKVPINSLLLNESNYHDLLPINLIIAIIVTRNEVEVAIKL